MSAIDMEAAKRAAGAAGWLSPRAFSTLAGIGEGHTRTAIREGKLECIRVVVNNQERVFISPVEVLVRHLPGLMSPATRAATIERLRLNARVARVDFDLEGLERNVQLLLNAMNAQPVEDAQGPIPAEVTWASAPVTEHELAEVRAD
jgi:hypothetical protein